MEYDDNGNAILGSDDSQEEAGGTLPSWISQYGSGWDTDVTSDDENSALGTTYANDNGTAAYDGNFDDWLSKYLENTPLLSSGGGVINTNDTVSPPSSSGAKISDSYPFLGGITTGTDYQDLLSKVTGTNGSLTGVDGIGNASSSDAEDAATSPITGGEGSGSLNSTVSNEGGSVVSGDSPSGNWWDNISSAISGAGGVVSSIGDALTDKNSSWSALTPALAALLSQQAARSLSSKAGNAPDASATVSPALSKIASNADAQTSFLNGVYDSLQPAVTNQVNATMSTADQQRKDSAALSSAGNSDLDLYKSSYLPVTQRAAADAAGYSYLSPEEQEAYDKANGTDTEANRILRQSQTAAENAAANTAGTAVDQNFSNQRAEATRKLSAMGINPNSGRSIDLTNRDMDIAQAIGKSGAEWKARTDAKESGIKARQVAADEGQKILSTGNQLLSTATGVGSQATTTASGGLNLASSIAGIKNSGFDAQTKANTTAVDAGLKLADLNSSNWKTQLVADQANATGYGNLLGGLTSSLLGKSSASNGTGTTTTTKAGGN